MADGGVLDGILAQGVGEEWSLIAALFETKRPDRLKMTSEVIPELEFPMATMHTIMDRYNSKLLKKFSRELLLLLVSKDRKGRLELVEALLSVHRQTTEEE